MDNLHYDAFISYRHTQVDSFVAKKYIICWNIIKFQKNTRKIRKKEN